MSDSTFGNLSPEDLAQARRRTVREWADIYLAVVEAKLRYGEEIDPAGSESRRFEYQSSVIPSIRRIADSFTAAGLDLVDEIEVEGVAVVKGPGVVPQYGLQWASNPPKVTYYWPDGSSLSFEGDDAVRSVGFFIFWQHQGQDPVLGNKEQEGQSRIILPGSPEHQRYMNAKNLDMLKGKEL